MFGGLILRRYSALEKNCEECPGWGAKYSKATRPPYGGLRFFEAVCDGLRSQVMSYFADLCALASLREIYSVEGDVSRKGAKPQRRTAKWITLDELRESTLSTSILA
jgi:hypothetical protein